MYSTPASLHELQNQINMQHTGVQGGSGMRQSGHTGMQCGRHCSKQKGPRLCQAVGCTVDLESLNKPYCVLKRICPVHMAADVVQCADGLWRFCQQCGKLEQLQLFDGDKRSCRVSLERRRAPAGGSSKSCGHKSRSKRQQQGQTTCCACHSCCLPSSISDADMFSMESAGCTMRPGMHSAVPTSSWSDSHQRLQLLQLQLQQQQQAIDALTGQQTSFTALNPSINSNSRGMYLGSNTSLAGSQGQLLSGALAEQLSGPLPGLMATAGNNSFMLQPDAASKAPSLTIPAPCMQIPAAGTSPTVITDSSSSAGSNDPCHLDLDRIFEEELMASGLLGTPCINAQPGNKLQQQPGSVTHQAAGTASFMQPPAQLPAVSQPCAAPSMQQLPVDMHLLQMLGATAPSAPPQGAALPAAATTAAAAAAAAMPAAKVEVMLTLSARMQAITAQFNELQQIMGQLAGGGSSGGAQATAASVLPVLGAPGTLPRGISLGSSTGSIAW